MALEMGQGNIAFWVCTRLVLSPADLRVFCPLVGETYLVCAVVVGSSLLAMIRRKRTNQTLWLGKQGIGR